MGKRMRAKPPGTFPSPGYEGIVKTLESCNAQTSSFDWNTIIQDVDHTIRNHFGYSLRQEFGNGIDQQSLRNRGIVQSNSRFLDGLSTALLLAAMNYLYIVQQFPEDRKILFTSKEGAIPLVVWANKILGLTVVIKSPAKHRREDLYFGDAQYPEMTIHWRDQETIDSGLDSPGLFLLDERSEVVLSTSVESTAATALETTERRSLENYGTVRLERHFNQKMILELSSPVYDEIIHLILGIVILISRKVTPEITDEDVSASNEYSLELWRIAEVTKVIFKDSLVKINLDSINNDFIPMLQGRPLFNLEFPPSIKGKYFKTLQTTGHDIEKESKRFHRLIVHLAFFIFAFAHIENVSDCRDIPLRIHSGAGVFGDGTPSQFYEQCRNGIRSLKLHPCTLFFYLSRRFLDYRVSEDEEHRTFLLSDFGWSVSLNCMRGYNEDPTKFKPWFLHLRRGIPTNLATGEQKSKIGDAMVLDSLRPEMTVIERGDSYNPRCENGVKKRAEYFSSNDRAFLLGIRFWVEALPNRRRDVEIYSSYRQLHENLCAVCVTDSCICSHETKNLETAKLGMNAATVKGFEWPQSDDFSARICIVLVRGDQHARWLAIQEASLTQRQTMVREEDCCEDCALDAVSAHPGKWILII
jgi:hypothetical protein